MIITDEMKNLKVYRRPLWLPTAEDSKKKGSAIFLLSPNYLSSKGLMMNPLLINKKRFESYYIEKDLTYFIKSGKISTSESYVREYTEADTYINLMEMTKAERDKLPDRKFGLPSKRKYPLDTREHVMSAIKFFNYVDKKDEKELAKNLNRAIDYFCDSGELPTVGKNNRFYKYYAHKNEKTYGEKLENSVIPEKSRAEIVDQTVKAFKDLGLKPNVSKDSREKFINGEDTDFGPHLCIAGLGVENLEGNCRKVNKVIRSLGARVTADNYGTAFLSIKEGKTYSPELGERRIVDVSGFYDNDGLYNVIVKLEGDSNRFRGRSEMLVIDGDRIFLDKKKDGTGFRVPGGGWDEYEDHMLAAIREVKEEARILVKDPVYMGHYVGFYNKKWNRDSNIPEKLRWKGFYTEVYIGIYDKRFEGNVDNIDQDTMAYTGKFYPISEVYGSLKPEHQEAINKYASSLVTTEACKDVATARRFVADVGKLAKKYNANYFIVTDGASGISNNGNEAVRHARLSQIELEKEHGYDPDEDWSGTVKECHLFTESEDPNYFAKFKYYHAEIERSGFNAENVKENWDEELYYKDIETALKHPYGVNKVDKYRDGLYGDYRCYLYTLGDDYEPVYLGICNVYSVSDWEWAYKTDLSPEMAAYIREEIQSSKSIKEEYEDDYTMDSSEYLSQVGEVVQKMISSNCEYFVPFGKFIPYEDGMAVGTMREESSSTLVALINEKLKTGVLRNYHVESHGAELGIDYLVVRKNDSTTDINFNNKIDQIKDEIFEAPKMVAEDGSIIETSGWVQSVNPVNTPATAVHSVSAIIKNDDNFWLLLNHKKCGGYTLPGGKIDPSDKNAGAALKRELFEELGIVPTSYTHYLTNTFLCNYPRGTNQFMYFTDHCFTIEAYVGELENKEPEKHNGWIFIPPSKIQEHHDTTMSTLLQGVIANKNRFRMMNGGEGPTVIRPSDITYSGFESSVRLLSHVCTPSIYKQVLNALELDNVIRHEDIPTLHFVAGDKDDIDYSNPYNPVITMWMENIEELESRPRYFYAACIYMMTQAILGAKFPAARNTALPQMIAEYIAGGPGFISDYRRDMITALIEKYGMNKIVALLPGADVQSLHKMAQDTGLAYESPYDYLKEAKIFDAESLTKKVKYTTTKLKRTNGRARNKTKKLMDKIVDDIQKKTETKVPDTTTVPTTDKNDKSVAESLLLESSSGNFGFEFSNMMMVFEDAKYDQKLRSLLYSERLIQRKDIIELYDRVKADCDFIKYTYPDLSRYQQKNLFIDLYFYNEVFFRNNDWKREKGFDLYFDLLDRLLNDKRISSTYKKKTVFIPILDWDKNKSTRMWMYKEDINPISIIFESMNSNPSRAKKLFGNMDLIFFGGGCYFKMNFSQMEDIKKSALRFKKFVMKVRSGEAFDPTDEEIETAETPKAIQTDLIDRIEDAKGVDLTSALNKVQQQKTSTKGKAPSDSSPTTKKSEIEKDKESSEDDEIKKSKLSQEPTPEDQANEKNKELLARAIDDVIQDPNLMDSEDALDRLDSDYVRDLLLSLDNDNEVKITQARADRMMQLDKELLTKQIKGKTVRDILSEQKTQKPLEHTKLEISSPNEQWKDLEYINYGRQYDKDADIIKAFQHFSQVSRPLVVRDMEVTDNSTSEDNVELYTVSLEDYRGTRYKVKLDIPVMNNRNRWKLRGGERNIQAQFANIPILKTDMDSAQVVSNYNKIIVTRFNTSTGRSMPQVSKFLKAANKYEGKKIKFITGNNAQICAKYNLPIDYIDLSSIFSKIETDDFVIYFNQDEIRSLYPVDEKIGIPFAHDKVNNTLIYLTDRELEESVCFTSCMMVLFKKYPKSYQEFVDLYNDTIPVNRGTYSRASIMSSKIPLVVVCAYSEGLTTVMKKAGISYELKDKLTSVEKRDPYYSYVKFKDGYIKYYATYAACLLMNGLKDCSTEMYSIGEIDNRNIYLDFLDNFGGRIKADGLDNAYDCTIDPITKEILEFYRLPTDYITALLYTNILLSDNKFIKHTDSSSRRLRREELIAAYTYKVLAEAYRIYANELKHGGSRAGFSVKQSAVIDKFLMDNTSSNSSVINMLNDVETTNAVTTKGLSGMNSERAYSLDKRTYDESMLNNIALSTGFAGNVGITRQATMNMNISTDRGFVKTIGGDTSQMNTANTLCATEAMIPLSTTHDDTMRIAMSFVQTSKHAVRIADSDPLLVTNGADEALAYMASDLFAHKAKGDGIVKEVTDTYVILEYKDGSKEYVNLQETIENNSDGGFYSPLKLDLHEKIKEGSKIKAGDIIAYDHQSLSNSVGESDHLAYNVGKLAKVALINTDEGFEDSGVIREGMSGKLATRIIEHEDVILDKNTNIFNMIKVGTPVEEGDTLLVWQNPYDEEDANAILKLMANDQDAVSELGRHRVKSPLTGRIAKIKISRTVEIEELSDSLQKMVKEYERPIKALKKKLDSEGISSKELPATYKLEATGNLKNARDAVKIEFYIEYNDIVAVGDKIVYMAANKAVIKNVIPDKDAPYTDSRPNEPVDALVSVTSIAKRMVTSIPIYGALQKLMVELDRSCKDIAGIPYDDSKV